MSRTSHQCDPDCPHLREGEEDFGQSLFQQIDIDNIVAHNEQVDGSCRRVFKPYSERLTNTPFARSSNDPELLIHIPFLSSVTLKSFVICGGSAQSAPSKVKLWVNREDIDFTSEVPPTQVFDLNFDQTASIEYLTKVSKFTNVSHLVMLFPDNFGDESTQINYIGLKGDVMGARRQAVIAVYESKPMGHNVENTAEKRMAFGM